MIHRFAILAAFAASLLLASTGLAQDATVVRRAALDIGSAAIKCTVADVDIATGRVLKIVETMSSKVDFAEDLDRSYDSNLSENIMDAGIGALLQIKHKAEQLEAAEFSAAGGAIFRQARNGRAYFVRIEKETGIKSRVISEQQAAMLSFHAAQQRLENTAKEVVVWDIGGASMHMTARRSDGGLLFYVDSMASISFKNAVIQIIQQKNPETTGTPNPVSAQQVAQALTYIKAHAMVAIPIPLKTKIRRGNVLVAGIGGVHYYSVPEMIGSRTISFSRDEVATTLREWTGKADAAFQSEYAATRLTNLILVLGYMDALGIPEIHPLKVSQADGLLTTREFW